MKKLSIHLNKINKRYIFQPERPTLIERLLRGKRKNFFALKNINLKIYRGEKIGIIGPNGSGKTTLLKIIAGITEPTRGKIDINGKVVSIIALEAGFHPELTGLENIFLNGLLIGMNKKDIIKKKSSIIKYADLGQFINMPIYTYSLGMKLRLGMSIALHSDPDILLLDENIGVGDQNFKNKLRNETDLLFNRNKTIIMASHNLYAIVDFCDKVIILEKGKIVAKGGLETIKLYESNFTYEYQPPTNRKYSKLSQELMKNQARTST